MQIEGMRLDNFQGFGPKVELSLAPITLIFGPNSSGKSSIGRALKVMKQTFTRGKGGLGFLWNGNEVEFGDEKNVIRGQLAPGQPEELILGLRVGYSSRSWSGQERHISRSFDLQDSLKNRVRKLRITSSGAQPGGLENFFALGLDQRKASKGLEISEWDSWGPDVVDAYLNPTFPKSPTEIPVEGRNADMEKKAIEKLLTDKYLHPQGYLFRFLTPDDYPDYWEDQLIDEHPISDFVASNLFFMEDVFSRVMTNLSFIDPIRPVPNKLELFEDEAERDLLEKDLTEKELKVINEILSELTQSRYEPHIRAYKHAKTGAYIRVNAVRDKELGVVLGLNQVGTGISQVLPVIRDIASGRGATYVEQPELHLHPKMQADLMDSYIHAYQRDPSRQFILETHSESMLLRLQKRLREGKLQGESVRILFVERGETDKPQDKFNIVQEMELDDHGDFLDPLPISFMDLRMQDLL